MSGYPKIIHTEEGMRDGLQIESPDIPLAAKVRLLNALSETGLKEIAVGSFVSPKWTPQMACMDDFVRAFTPKPGVRYTYTALNDKGQDRAAEYTPPLSPKGAIQMNDVYVDDRNIVYAADRFSCGVDTLEVNP